MAIGSRLNANDERSERLTRESKFARASVGKIYVIESVQLRLGRVWNIECEKDSLMLHPGLAINIHGNERLAWIFRAS